MKLTREQLLAFLKQVGLEDVELVEEEDSADADEQAFIDLIDSNRRAILEPQLQQQIATQIAGKAGASLRNQLTKLTGMARKDLDAIAKDTDAIQAAIEFKLKGTDSADQINEIIRTHESELEAVRAELSAEAETWRNKYNDRDIVGNIRSLLDKAPLPAKADKNILAEDFKSYLSGRYDLSFDEQKRALSLFQKGKGGEKIPAIVNGNKLVSVDDELKSYFAPRNLWEEDMRRVKPEAPKPAAAAPNGLNPTARNYAHGEDAVSKSLGAFDQWLKEQE